MKYQHLFFDLDHTLWDFDANAEESLSELYKFFNLESKAIIPFNLFYTTYLNHNAILWHRYENGFISTDELKWRRMWRTLLDFKIADEELASAGLSKYFQNIITSEVSNSVKPKKEIFDYALKKVSGKLEESIMIGDNPDADILGAINAGMDSIFVNYINANCKQKPTYIIHHLKELRSIF